MHINNNSFEFKRTCDTQNLPKIRADVILGKDKALKIELAELLKPGQGSIPLAHLENDLVGPFLDLLPLLLSTSSRTEVHVACLLGIFIGSVRLEDCLLHFVHLKNVSKSGRPPIAAIDSQLPHTPAGNHSKIGKH